MYFKKKPVQQSNPVPISLQNLYTNLEQKLENKIDNLRLEKFVELGERISKELNVTNYWVCGGTLMSEK